MLVHAWWYHLRPSHATQYQRTFSDQSAGQGQLGNNQKIRIAFLLMLNLDTVKSDIERWIVDFVEVPHPALGNWPPCPYAKKARLERDFEVRLGRNPFEDLISISYETLPKSVVILAYDPAEHPYEQFHRELNWANESHLLPKDIIALEDHPDDPEIVNGICMNQGTYALALVQSLTDLNQKARLMAKKGFYDNWPEEYLEMLFQHRQDPRK